MLGSAISWHLNYMRIHVEDSPAQWKHPSGDHWPTREVALSSVCDHAHRIINFSYVLSGESQCVRAHTDSPLLPRASTQIVAVNITLFPHSVG